MESNYAGAAALTIISNYAKKIVTERDIVNCRQGGEEKCLRRQEYYYTTPAAKDKARELKEQSRS